MEQRRLRLGDILDDYCPRERRVTNHAVVAMIEDDIKQTRCTTCDAEHAYKGGKAPRRRKKDAPALVGAVDAPAGVGAVTIDGDDDDVVDVGVGVDDEVDSDEFLEPETALSADSEAVNGDEPISPVEDGPVHRPLLRAKLPRPEGQKIERQMPDFTIRHVAARGHGSFRGSGRPKMRAHGAGTGNGNGHGNGSGNRQPSRFSGQRPGAPGRSGPSGGFRSGPPRHGGKKHSR